ncbi:MAG: hypothetical protein RLZ25_129 [Pseudomonadota bacterium]|jgi:predicted adenine nucleotide alpha hydrolase (AANH) superfamily ATPase
MHHVFRYVFRMDRIYAHENQFPVMTSFFGSSRRKNMQQINECGNRSTAPYPRLTYWDCNWPKGGGSAQMIEISKRENFNQQEYCGCAYSLPESNKHRLVTVRERIKLGVMFYSESEA